MDDTLQVVAYLSSLQIDILFLPFFEDFKIKVSDSRLDISANSEQKCNIYISNLSLGVYKSNFEN